MVDEPGVVARPWYRLDDAERARTVGFARRMHTVRNPSLAVLAIAAITGTITYGPLILLPILAIAISFVVLGFTFNQSRYPELLLLGTLIFGQFMICTIFALSKVYALDSLGLLIIPMAAVCMVFPRRIVPVTTLWSALVMTGAAFAIDAQRVIDMPPVLLLPLGVMFCVALPAAMIRQLEIASRDTAFIDSLTGALNRAALESRITELSAQALPLKIGVIMGDLDHFKAVNDELGHEVGDAVLVETVRRMRAMLGPLTPLYRVGGEEFAVLLAGADEGQVEAIAERLRRTVRETQVAGQNVTMSFGIAAGTLAQHSVGRIIEVADDALYRAKRGGRDRVSAATLTPMTVVPAAVAPGGDPQPVLIAPGAATKAAHAANITVVLGHDRGNWLVRGDFERDHIRESAKALSGTHHGAMGFVFVALLACTPWLGWELMIPAVFAVIVYHAVERRIMRIRQPEYALGGAWLLVQLSIFAGALITLHPEPYMLVLFTPMVIGMTAVFPTRGVVMNTAITAVLIVAAGALARPDLLQALPGLVVPSLVLMTGIALMSSVTGRSAIEHRTKAVVDPLTGLLTRAALQSRLIEIDHESQVAGSNVSVIAFDVDDFKGLNDEHGHALGDAVLRAVGTAIRRNLQALEWGFRLGGDEFAIVIPTAQDEAVALAERLRKALAAIVVDDVRITGSFGVAATGVGERFDYESVSRRADSALYEAKRAGRNRVALAPIVAPGVSPVATVLRDIA